MGTEIKADAGSLGVVLDLVEEGLLPRLHPLDRAVYQAAVERLRRLRVRLLAGEVLVLTTEDL